MAASVLVFEAFIALFFGLVVAKLHPSDDWAVAVALGVASIVLSGMLRYRWAYGAGWALQAGFIAAGVFVTDMYVLGVIFAALWWAGLHYGAKAEHIRAARSQAAAAEGGSGGGAGTSPAGAAQVEASQSGPVDSGRPTLV